MKGGARAGAGRKKGSVNKVSAEAREAAKATGELPHEFLLRVSRGETIQIGTTKKGKPKFYTPSFAARFNAAVAAAPYFQPKLASVEQKIEGTVGVVSPEPMDEKEWLEKYGAAANRGVATTEGTSEGPD